MKVQTIKSITRRLTIITITTILTHYAFAEVAIFQLFFAFGKNMQSLTPNPQAKPRHICTFLMKNVGMIDLAV